MRRIKYSSLILLVVFALFIASCAPDAAVATEEPKAEEAAVTEEKTEAEPVEAEKAVTAEEEASSGLAGQLQLAGSTTVQPLAEKAAEAFMAMNPDVKVEVQGGGSSTGVTSIGEGTVDIGNASRAVKDEELETYPDINIYTIAYDGIAIVTNPGVQLESLSIDQVRGIFSGEITNYSEVGGPDAEIIVISREEGSGTRGAFEELVMEYKDDAGEKQLAPITETAILQNSNGAVRTNVAETPDSIAFLSFGYLDDSVSATPIDGVEGKVENVLNGSYPIFRPLNMITKGESNELANAYIDFILSEEGQAIVVEEGYISVSAEESSEAASSEAAAVLEGQLQLAGSTTVQPLAEKAAEAFMAMNPDLKIEIQGGGSSTGVTSIGEGTVDIGNASREVKDSELEQYPDLNIYTIAYDGIAIVTNPSVELESLTTDEVRAIFSGEITNYSEIGGPDAEIIVISREEGSGTRGAFEELVMEYKDDAGEKQLAPITETAILQNSNGAVRTNVAETPDSIAFLSFGYLDDSVYATPIDGVEPTVDHVKDGSYSIFRPLNMITKGESNELANAFIDYMLSDAGQTIVVDEGYMTVK